MASVATVLVKDSVIGDITSELSYAIKSGGANITYQPFNSISTSNSNLVFNVQVPSENTVFGRDVLITSGLSFTIKIEDCPAGATAFDYGLLDSLQAFPLASLMTTLNAQINNTSVSINLQDVLPQLLTLTSRRELQRWNGMTPALRDSMFRSYAEGAGATSNPMGELSNAGLDVDILPRGAFPVDVTIGQYSALGAYVSASNICATLGNVFYVVVQTVVTEPLFVSPFIFANPEFNAQGLLGINNMVIQANIDATLKRVFSAVESVGGTPLVYTVSAGAVPPTLDMGLVINPNLFQVQTTSLLGNAVNATPTLLFRFISTQPSDVIQSKNAVPYMDYPRYLTPSFNVPAIASGVASSITSSNIQLNQIPDLFIICIRKPMATMTIADSNSFMKINTININLNNSSGLLSSSSAYDLWRMSVKNGSTQSWLEFSGQATLKSASGTGQLVNTTGSVLIINPAYDLSLPDYLSNGSIGSYNFQFSVNVTNTVSDDAVQPEMVTICANSGVFTTQQGSSQVFTGLATKEMVLSAKAQKESMSSSHFARLVGGKLMNHLGLRSRLSHKMERMGAPASTVGGRMSGGKLHSLC